MIFKERLTEALKYDGRQQKEIAKLIGISPSNLSMYKKGDTEPTLEILYKICQVLDITSDYLLGLSDY